MASMTKEQLQTLISETVTPLVKEAVGPLVTDMVTEQFKGAEAQRNSKPEWLEAFMASRQSTTTDAPKRTVGGGAGRIIRAIALGKAEGSGLDGAIADLKRTGDADLAEQMTQQKALAAGSGPAGGYLVPVQQSTEVLMLRRAATVVRALGPREVPLPTGTLNIPKIATGATGSYIAENANITKSQQVFGNVQLTAHKLAVIVPISNDLVRNSSPGADAVVTADLVRSLAVTEDVAFIRGDGTNGSPKGLKWWAPASNTFNAATVSLANVATDLGTALTNLMNNNVVPGNWAWIFAPRTWKYLTTVQNSNGFYAFRDEMVENKTLWGFPYRVTTSVPVNQTVGSNADCSEVYLANFDDMVIGDNLTLKIDVSQEAAYYDGSSVVAAFSQDQTVIRAIAEHDFAARYAEAISVITGVRWGV